MTLDLTAECFTCRDRAYGPNTREKKEMRTEGMIMMVVTTGRGMYMHSPASRVSGSFRDSSRNASTQCIRYKGLEERNKRTRNSLTNSGSGFVRGFCQ